MRSKYFKYGIFGFIFLIVAGGIFLKLYSPKTDAAETDAVQNATAEVQRGSIQVTAGGTGSIQPSVRKEVMTINSGTVDKIYVEEGQSVKEGDLILTFEDDTKNTTIERAKLNVTAAEKRLKDLQEDLNSLKVYAPSSGVLGEIKANVGEQVSKGLFTTITDSSKMEVIGKFNKNQINSVKVGDEAKVLMLYNYQTVAGKVIKVNDAPSSNENGAVLYDVTLEIDNPGGYTPGMQVQMVIDNENGSFSAVENGGLTAKIPYKVELSTGGTLTKLNVSEGEYVEAGELIAEMQNEDLYTQIADQEIKVQEAQLDLSEKLKNTDNNAIHASISGTITKVNVTSGESVRDNAVVAVVSDLENLEVIIPIDELDINKVKVGQEATAAVEAGSQKTYKAKVSEIALEGSSTGGVATFDVTISLSEGNGLKPGMTANAEIISSKKEDALLLPIEAIQQRGNQKFVIPSSAKSLKQGQDMIPVKVGLVSENYVEIIEGLNEGDKVVYPIVGAAQNQQGPNFNMMRFGGTRSSGGERPQGSGGR